MRTDTSETRIWLPNLRNRYPEMASTKEHIKLVPRKNGIIKLWRRWLKEPREISILKTHSPWTRTSNWFHVDGVTRAGNMRWKIQQNRNSLRARTELIHTDGQQKDLNQLWEHSIAVRWTQLKIPCAQTARAHLEPMVKVSKILVIFS